MVHALDGIELRVMVKWPITRQRNNNHVMNLFL